jgi:pimeloyl-ACP methyl ester carboxylesterase
MKPVRRYQPEPGVSTVQANGLRFGFLAWGTAGNPLALLLHGFPDTPHTWDGFAPALAHAGFHVVAPFLRGYAPTEVPGKDTTTQTLGEDVLGLISALGSSQAVVIGHDWGADAAYAAAALRPERIRKLVTVAIPHRGTLAPTPKLLWALRHIFTLSFPGAARRFAADDFAQVERLIRRWSPAWQFSAQELDAVKNAFCAQGCLDAALGYYRAVSVRLPPVLRRPIAVPTLVVAGRDDPGAPLALYAQAKRQFTGGCEVVAIGGGHFCHRESPKEFEAAVLPFLSR